MIVIIIFNYLLVFIVCLVGILFVRGSITNEGMDLAYLAASSATAMTIVMF
jgi:hypothetical protein